MNRRALLIVGGGIAAGGTGILGWRILNNQGGLPGSGNGNIEEPDGDFEPEDNLPDEDERTEAGERDNVWNTDSLTIDFTTNEDYRNNAHFDVEPHLQNAVEYWNEYIDENEEFTLELSVEQDASDPDILLNHDMHGLEELVMDGSCFEYDNLGDLSDYILPMACVSSVTEDPEDTPVSATIGFCGSSYSIYERVTKHVLGRLIGYNVMDAPRDVMTVEHMASPFNLVMSTVDHYYEIIVEDFIEDFMRGPWDNLQEEEHTDGVSFLEAIREQIEDGMPDYLNDFEEIVEERFDEDGLTRYVEAFDETVFNGPEVQLMDDALESFDTYIEAVEEYRQSPEPAEEQTLPEFRDVEETLEKLFNGSEHYEPWALRAHLHWSEQLWNEHFE